MRKVFLDELPRKGKKIDWKKCIGLSVKFIYESIEGCFVIVEYDEKNCKIKVKYNDKICELYISYLKEAKLRTMLGIRSSKFKYEIGRIFKDDKRDLVIIDREYKYAENDKVWKWYTCSCNTCGNIMNIEENHLRKGHLCVSCTGKVATPMNCIWNNQRWMCDLGLSEEDAKTHTYGSHSKVEVVCPDCGNKKITVISRIYRNKSISCSCSDKGKYPEKFMMSVLNQLGVEFITQLTKTSFKWCDKYRYDFYIPSPNIIIETHGEQHYKDSKRGRSLKEEQENDKLKRELALSNKVEKYIVIDCRKSEMEWIKNSILNSELGNVFDLSKIDWMKCEEFALKNITKEICDYWNNKEEWETTQTIADNNPWGIRSRETIREYLKKGVKHGLTNYNPKEEMKKNGNIGKKVICLENGIVCETILEMSKVMSRLTNENISKQGIRRVTIGEIPNYKNYTFKEVV